MERRSVFPAQAQVEDQFRSDPIVILSENAVHLGDRPNSGVADELLSSARSRSEEVLQWGGISNCCNAITSEINPAPCVVGVGIALDVREFSAEFEAVLADQVREI